MKNLNIKELFSRFGKNTAWIFLAVLFLLFVFEVLEIKNSADIIITAKKEAAKVPPEKGIHIDFNAYGKALERKQRGEGYIAPNEPVPSPFGTASK